MITLVRETKVCDRKDYIEGSMYINGGLLCHTIENASKALPSGRYRLIVCKSPHFKRDLPLIVGDTFPDASNGYRIHAGNSCRDSDGCILVGFKRGKSRGVIEKSLDAETAVTMIAKYDSDLEIR